MEKIGFKIYGNHITDFMRSLVMEGSVEKSWDVFETISSDQSIFNDIIRGKKKFDGLNEFQLIEDNYQFDEEEFLKILSYSKNSKNIKAAKEKLNVTMSEKNILLYKYHSNKMKNTSAWINEYGLFFPVEMAGHINKIDEFHEAGLLDTDSEQDREREWVKISEAAGLPIFFANKLTARQKLTLEKYLKENDMLKRDDVIPVYGFGNCIIESGRVKFEKR